MIIDNEEIFILDYLSDSNKKIVYAPLRSYLALVREEAALEIYSGSPSHIKDQIISRIKSKGFLNMQTIIDELQNTNPELSIAITDNCNLRCIYCHASAGDKGKQKTMSYRLIDAIINKYFETIKQTNTVQISFNGGGEPTYNFNKLKYAVNKIKEISALKGVDYKLSMATNGFYGDKIRKFIVDEFFEVSLSFDGPEHIQNLHRPLPNGNGSFTKVFDTAIFFRNAGFNMAFRATVSDYSIKYLEEIVDFFAMHFPGTSLGLENLNPFGRGAYCEAVKPPDKNEFSRGIIHLLNYIKDKPISIINSATTDFDIIRPVFCTNVGIPSWTVDVNGVIYACHRDGAPDEFVFGKYDLENDRLTLDSKKIESIRSMVVFNYEECKDCFCKYHCAGDCPDRRLMDKLDCNSTQQIGIKILNDKLNNEKNLQYGNTFSSSRNQRRT